MAKIRTTMPSATGDKRVRVTKELQKALIAADEKAKETYAVGSTITAIVNESARREVGQELLVYLKRLVKEISPLEFSVLKPTDQMRVIKGYVETLQLLSDKFKGDQQEVVGNMSDDDLEKIAAKKAPN